MAKSTLSVLWCFLLVWDISWCSTNYKLIAGIPGFKSNLAGDTYTYGAGAGSKFTILSETEAEYKVMFSRVTDYDATTARITTLMAQGNEQQQVRTVSLGKVYIIAKSDLPDYLYTYSSGDIGGVLAVPFKLINNGKVSPGATLGGFYGYKMSTVSLIASAGLASIPTTDVNSKQVQTSFGLTGAIGIVFEPKPKFQLGIIFGIDHLGSDWLYEDRGWVSLAVGFVFTQ
jgi:hypothetical protein